MNMNCISGLNLLSEVLRFYFQLNFFISFTVCTADKHSWFLDILRQYQPNLSTAAALRLDLEVDEEMELPLVWLTAATLVSIWDQNKDSTRVQPHLTRSQLEAKVNLLRETRLSNMAILLKQLINNMFDQ